MIFGKVGGSLSMCDSFLTSEGPAMLPVKENATTGSYLMILDEL